MFDGESDGEGGLEAKDRNRRSAILAVASMDRRGEHEFHGLPRLLFCFHAGDRCLARRDLHQIFVRRRPPQSWDFVPFRREVWLGRHDVETRRSSIESCRSTKTAAISSSCRALRVYTVTS